MVKDNTEKTTKARNTRAKTDVKVEEPVSETVQVEKPKRVEKEPQPKQFKQSEGIKCRSVTPGKLYMDGIRSSMPYTWLDYGDEIEVEYRDLVAAVREKNSFVMKPFFVILDADFLVEFPFLKDVYDKQYSTGDLTNILRLSTPQMVEEIAKLPANVKDTLKKLAATWVGNGNIDSVKKIKALDEVFDTNLSLVSEFVNE